MKVEQIYTGCLAEAAYYIESNGECAIIDPLRETAPYIKRAEKNGANIKYIFETHFHADFVSGHLELSQQTGAAIVYGAKAETSFECIKAKDSDEFKVGDITIRALHTPGHTPESTTYLLLDENRKEYCIFTGDTLFIGDVGRPDLAIKSNVTKEDLAGMLFDSLRNKIMTLPDDVIVYPAHGAGSSCGKSMSKETFDTLGHQKQVNYALQNITRDEFIKQVTEGLLPPPQYFSKNAMLNKHGAGNMEEVYQHGLRKLSAVEFEAAAQETNALVLDTRDAQVFCKAFIPGSVNIGLNGQFAVWVGTLITDLNQPILLVCDEGKAEECIMRLARVGYDNTLGYLDGGIGAWKAAGKETDAIASINAGDFAEQYSSDTHVLDVRRPAEFETEHVAGAENKPLDFINDWTNEADRNKTYFIHCAGGYRSMVAASILKARGFENIVEVAGGYGAIAKTAVPKTDLIHAK
ncbi:MAG TPA: MBL fold metallo-hydrolase [Chitinophagales bacterium]|nr:MBL fold metallo-hydrolase [Chitinophagales bacterium]